MSIASRISLGIAFLIKPKSSNTSLKCIIHAEYVVKTRQYLLTKINYTHTRTFTVDTKIHEQYFEDVAHILKRLVRSVEHKLEDGYAFDTDALELLAEEDEQWGDYELLGKSSDPLLDDLSNANAVEHESSGPTLWLRNSRTADSVHRIATRRDKPVSMTHRIRMALAQKHSPSPRMRVR